MTADPFALQRFFGAVATEEPAFAEALQKYFGGVPDAATLARM